MKKVGWCLVAVAMIFIGGGHLLILQSIAWSRMISHYSQSIPWYKAVEKTLSGKESCRICEKIPRSFRDSPLKSQVQPTDKELMFVCLAPGLSRHELILDSYVSYSPISFSCSPGEPPPTPPPKFKVLSC
ncbi:hypothetical protein [Candidatus Methylacidiphilum infernorum]|uniref:Uncharacterized protein n=1 Tax=Methylacidiphilum infernorum (isolate V4) TaxID=481448 RepID=B3DYL2_METI4|nr:hypothetical protein [Candidatus Methylacidiphilum infernorum]ACD84060.1 Conserved hypothetical protein [Methylacidiphilum infernorum V4]